MALSVPAVLLLLLQWLTACLLLAPCCCWLQTSGFSFTDQPFAIVATAEKRYQTARIWMHSTAALTLCASACLFVQCLSVCEMCVCMQQRCCEPRSSS